MLWYNVTLLICFDLLPIYVSPESESVSGQVTSETDGWCERHDLSVGVDVYVSVQLGDASMQTSY